MPYTALYRKLRPQKFAEVIGQQHITKTLINQITTKRIPHAYLFCGTRGTGKTSTARLYARAVNCTCSDNGEPCNICEACQSVINQRSLDIIEIDAASNNSVDNVRDLREEVKYPPSLGKFKVYIIDEVHMLSSGAFNALLKTLEEPPEHVIFVLATTDPQKIPPTIHSRCQRFDFKRISTRDIFSAIKTYIKNLESPANSDESDIYTSIDIDDDALMYIATLADGSMRDALSILEQSAAIYINSRISLVNVQEIIGAADKSVFYELTDALISFDTNKCMKIIAELVINGRDIGQFVNELIVHFRNLLLIREISKDSKSMDFSLDNAERLSAQSIRISPAVLIKYINSFSLLNNQLRYASNERIILEIECIRLCNPHDAAPSSSETIISSESYIKVLEQRINKLSDMLEKNIEVKTINDDKLTNVTNVQSKHEISVSATPLEKAVQQQKPKNAPEDIKAVISGWSAFVSEFDMPLKLFLQKAKPVYHDGGILQLTADDGCLKNLKKHEDKIKDQLNKKYNKSFEISFIDKNKYDGSIKNVSGMIDKSELDPADFTDKINMDIIFEN